MATNSKVESDRTHSSEESEAVLKVKSLVLVDAEFAKALQACASTEDAAALAKSKGINVSPSALWRNRGVLNVGGHPTWRG